MISDAEQRRLDEIERLLRLDDPALVRRFDERPQTPRTAVLVAFALLVTPVVVAVAGVLGGPISALVAVCVMTTMCFGLVRWRRRGQPPRRWR
jgi:Flp pilus assembly protein TadB